MSEKYAVSTFTFENTRSQSTPGITFGAPWAHFWSSLGSLLELLGSLLELLGSLLELLSSLFELLGSLFELLGSFPEVLDSLLHAFQTALLTERVDQFS